jgi:hypothetical protein
VLALTTRVRTRWLVAVAMVMVTMMSGRRHSLEQEDIHIGQSR